VRSVDGRRVAGLTVRGGLGRM